MARPRAELPFRLSDRAAGDLSRCTSLDDSDLGLGGLLWLSRDGGSVGVPEYELDLDVPGRFDDIRGISVGVSE